MNIANESQPLVRPGERQFSLRSLLRFVLIVGGVLAILRESGPGWIVAYVIIGGLLVMCATLTWRLRLRIRRQTTMLVLISIPSCWLLWLGLYPGLYHIGDVFFVLLYWAAVPMLYFWGTTQPPFFAHRKQSERPLWTNRERLFFLVPIAVTLMIACRVPLRIGFLTAWPRLSILADTAVRAAGDQSAPSDGAIALKRLVEKQELAENQECGLYTISLAWTCGCHVPDRIQFELANDSESAFIYSANGIDDLCYNSGTKGHLFGNWYWRTED
jgi:hypothetical protein